jgi:DNA invertase Pin-like site-specific DNA recombinase
MVYAKGSTWEDTMSEKQTVGNRVALYARVSTTNHHQDVQVQLRDLKTYVKLHGWIVAAEYIDHISSAKKNRPQLEHMMADAKKNKFGIVACWKFDRVSRSAIELVDVLDQLKKLKINFVSMTESVDTTTPMGEFVVTVLGAVGKMERSMISERVKAGLRNAKAKGKQLGHPSPTPITKRLIERVHELNKEGQSLRDIAKQVKVSHVTVARLLKSA